MRTTLLITLMFGLLCQAFGQDSARVGDLRVGLVLSGGGAKGMAHIGALKVIEESGVRLDYIGGTSMGAIVGALYASGYSARELDSLFTQTDFTNLIQDDLPRRGQFGGPRPGWAIATNATPASSRRSSPA